ncbi:MAG: hypothetical protein MAG794_00216 [Gammaproteobacteria bacterium]|nr:hypothetical protein [Gammaproteobacteria bacterium]
MTSSTPSLQSFVNAPRILFAPVPLSVLQPLLQRVASNVVRTRPGLFERLGTHKSTRFLIDPTNLPFAVLLRPDPNSVLLKAVRRREEPHHDARIAGTFLTLLNMVDGRLDGDALFFSRDLQVTGDTEAVVSLRNALDDLEGSIADDIASLLGPPGRFALKRLRALKRRGDEG